MNSNHHLEENLLEETRITQTIDFKVDDSSHYLIQIEREFSCHSGSQGEEFQLSSNQEEVQVLTKKAQDQMNLKLHFPLTHSNKLLLKEKDKKIIEKPVKNERFKTLLSKNKEKVVQLDVLLVQMYCQEILTQALDYTSKISELILCEEFYKVKSYQKGLFQSIKQVQKVMMQMQNQKRAMMNQIAMLKGENQTLRMTAQELFQIIKDLQTNIDVFYENVGSDIPHERDNLSKCNTLQPDIPTFIPFSQRDKYQKIQIIEQRKNRDIMSYFFDLFDQNMNSKSQSLGNICRKNGEFWLKVLTSLVTFLGLLISSEQKTQVNRGDKLCNKFIWKLKSLKQCYQGIISTDEMKFWNKILNFVKDFGQYMVERNINKIYD